MKCTYDGEKLVFRKPKKTQRAGVNVLRLICPKCGAKFLCTDAPYSHPYQTRRPSGLVGAYFDIRSDQKAWLKKHGNQSELVRRALDNFIKRVYTEQYKS